VDSDQTQDQQFEYLPAGLLVGGRYEILKLLGSGGMGAVYLVRDNVLGGEQLAMKVLHRQFAFDKKYTQRFLREVQLMRRVNHLNVVRTYDVGADNDIVYFTMELVPGRSLLQVIEQLSLSKSQLVSLIVQLCEGLAAIHSAGIIHRDLKPENVIILDDGTVKITDFGVARPEESQLTAHNEVIGSSAYIAPEVWLGQPLTTSVDLYALGVILYEIATGVQPFEASAPAAIMRLHLDSHPTPPRQMNNSIPPWLNKLTLSLLEKSPLNRPKSALDIVKQLELLNISGERSTLGELGNISSESAVLFSKLETITKRSADNNATHSTPRDTRQMKPLLFSSESSLRPSVLLSKFVGYQSVYQMGGDRKTLSRWWLGCAIAPALLGMALIVLGYVWLPAGPVEFRNLRGMTPELTPWSSLMVLLVSAPCLLLLLLSWNAAGFIRTFCYSSGYLLLVALFLTGQALWPLYFAGEINLELITNVLWAYKQNIIEIGFLSPYVTRFESVVLTSTLRFDRATIVPITETPVLLSIWGFYLLGVAVLAKKILNKTARHPELIYTHLTFAVLLSTVGQLSFPELANYRWTLDWLGSSAPVVLSPAMLLNWISIYLVVAVVIPFRKGARIS